MKWIRNILCFLALLGLVAQVQAQEPPRPGVINDAELPTLPELAFERTPDGKVVIDERQLVAYLNAQTALMKAASQEVRSATAEQRNAKAAVDAFILERQHDIVEMQARTERLNEMGAYMQRIYQDAKKMYAQLQETRQINAQTQMQLASAQGQIGGALSEIERMRKKAWIPFPISLFAGN